MTTSTESNSGKNKSRIVSNPAVSHMSKSSADMIISFAGWDAKIFLCSARLTVQAAPYLTLSTLSLQTENAR
eukprot:scaffold2974_cov39-Prasinocladus_malaysianus.AAC.1